MAVLTFFGSLVSLAVLPFVPFPNQDSWPLLALAVVIHTAYHFCLPMAYQYGDYGQVYPIARGSAPLIVTMGGVLLVGEVINFLPLLGVVFLSIGVMTLALDSKDGLSKNPKAILFALGTGVFIASYTLVGGLGARQAGSAIGFAVILTIGNGLATFVIALFWKFKEIKKVVLGNWMFASAGGGMQVGAYWIIIWAMAYAPLGMVSALRETSVLFAAIISTFVLKEGFGVWRFISSGLIAFGIALTRYR